MKSTVVDKHILLLINDWRFIKIIRLLCLWRCNATGWARWRGQNLIPSRGRRMHDIHLVYTQSHGLFYIRGAWLLIYEEWICSTLHLAEAIWKRWLQHACIHDFFPCLWSKPCPRLSDQFTAAAAAATGLFPSLWTIFWKHYTSFIL